MWQLHIYLSKKRESFHFCLVAVILREDFNTNVLKKKWETASIVLKKLVDENYVIRPK